ncbi:MAG: hypothetical protein M5U26_14750 [Planctomycetota bacterium]|nr:hypothetical protein [Planctomycetota bacterium]
MPIAPQPRLFAGRARGIALIMVIVVLAALTALLAPFAFSMIMHGRSARSDLTAAQAKAGAEAAINHGIARLQNLIKAPGFDPTPDWDTLAELKIDMSIPAAGVNLQDPNGLLWSTKVEDEQGKVNLITAPPTLLGNLLYSTTLTESVDKGAGALLVDDVDAFPCDDDPSTVDGFVRIGGDTVPYRDARGNQVLLAPQGAYTLENGHRQGALVYDGRAIWICDYKFRPGEAEYRPFRSIYEIKAISAGGPTLAVKPDEYARIERFVTIHSGLEGPGWGHAERISEQSFQGDAQTFTVENDNGFGPGTVVRFFQGGRTITYGRLDGVRVDRRSARRAYIHLERPVGVGASGSGVGNDIFVVPEIRHPININTAPPEVLAACFTGVCQAAGNESVQRNQALRLAYFLVTDNRTYRDADDLKKALDEAHTAGIVTGQQRDALQINATEYNSPKLRTSTVPFCYRSLGSFTVEGTGIVSAKNGVQLARHTLRQTVTLPSPPPGHFELKTQEDFQRLIEQGMSNRVVSWPVAMDPESNRFRRIGVVREPDPRRGDVRLSVGETGPHGFRGEWIEHCDDPRDPGYFQEGYDMTRREPFQLPGAPARNGHMQPGSLECWYRPTGAGSVVFFDWGQEPDRNRITMSYEAGNGLVMRIADANLYGKSVEYRWPVDLDAATWHHVAGSWRTSWPGGQEFRVDAQPVALKEAALFNPSSHLADDIKLDDVDVLNLEEDLSLPDMGAVLVGQEIVEYTGRNGTSLTGLTRGTRMSTALDHVSGEIVTLYGYSVDTSEQLPVGGSTLVEDLAANRDIATRVLVPKPPPDDFIPEDETGKLTVADATMFPKSGYIDVAGEVIYYGDRSATTFTKLERGQEGSTPRDLRNNAQVRLASLYVSGEGDYPTSGLVAVDSDANDMVVEWIAYNGKRNKDGKVYFLPHFNRTTSTSGNPPRTIVSLGIGEFRGRYGTSADLSHAKKAKLIPVIRVAGPHCGDANSPQGAGISDISVLERGVNGGDKRWVKRAFVRQYANTRDRRDASGKLIAIEFIDWAFEYLVGLDDFVSRPYPARNTRYLKWPSGELPEGGQAARSVGASIFGDGRINGYADEFKANVLPSLGGKVAMDISGLGMPAGSTDVAIELDSAWARPAGGRGTAFDPVWPQSGFVRIEDEMLFYTSSSTVTVTYFADKAPTLEAKAARTWTNPLTKAVESHPNIDQKRVLRLSGLTRGLLRTQAVDHPPGAGAMLYDAAPFTALRGGLGPTDDRFAVIDGKGFPAEGYAWIDNEVLSWTQGGGTSFHGCSVFRGRYGTSHASHDDGALVRCLPFRYWDRQAYEYDGAGLAYIQMGYSAKDAIWDTVDLVTKGPSGEPLPTQVRPYALVRFDGRPGWDSQPTNQEGGLYEFRGSGVHKLKGFGKRGGVRATQIELRVYWKYESGAFVPNHDWKRTFGLDEVRATYHSPLLYRRLEEVEQR